jgi:putative ABC transport system ATP-binding protein
VILQTDKVCKYFRRGTRAEVRAVQEVTLAIEPGSFVLLTGPSGSGKTTLLALLGALERPSSGRVCFEGRDLGGCSDVELARVRRRMGMVFQHFNLIPGLPVWENITYPLIPCGVRRARRRERAAQLLDQLGLADRFQARPQELSGGEQQRVAVARALVGQPAVLLADEPTSNLDVAGGQSLIALLQRLHQQGTTLIVASHDLRMAPVAAVVYAMETGRLRRMEPASLSETNPAAPPMDDKSPPG